MVSLTPEKTRLDMQQARERTEIDVVAVRDFIHGALHLYTHCCLLSIPSTVGSSKQWEEHSRLVNMFAKDPLFDRSQRSVPWIPKGLACIDINSGPT